MYNIYDTWTVNPAAVNTVESVITDLTHNGVIVTKADKKKIDSIINLPAWTVKQAQIALKLLIKYEKFVTDRTILDKPIFKNQPVDLNTYLNQNTITMQDGVAVFNSGYNANLIQDIKNLKYSENGKTIWPKWNMTNKTWSILVTDGNICNIVSIGKKYNLKIDNELLEKSNEIENKVIEDKTLLLLNDGQHITLAGHSIVIASTNLSLIEKIKEELGIKHDQN